MKSYEDTGWRIDNLDALRDKLQSPKSYKKYSDFRRFALEPAHAEINSNSDIKFKYEEVKTGNKVIALKFSIKSSKCEEDSKEIAIGIDKDPEIIKEALDNLTHCQ
ncbi:hypothetical protein [Clostridium sp. FP2]|uniref:hypothetical protein n=1 Tax=Clostridium sp. FP2 TaxID=2724481 RepID=UPI00398CA29F